MKIEEHTSSQNLAHGIIYIRKDEHSSVHTLCPNQVGSPSSKGIFSGSTEKSVRISWNIIYLNKLSANKFCKF